MDVVERFHSRILHVDLKDTERMGIHQVVPFGQGVTDNQGVVERLLEHGYSGYLVVEMAKADPHPRQTQRKNLTAAYEMFMQYQTPIN